MSKWATPVIETLRSLWDQGLSVAQCSNEIYQKHGVRFGRSAVRGKIFRLGMSGQADTATRRNAALSGQARRGNYTRAVRIRNLPHVIATSPELAIKPIESIPFGQRKTILELDNTHCRWPYGHPSDANFFYCGAPDADVIEHRPYCAFHTRIARGSSRRDRVCERLGYSASPEIRNDPAGCAFEVLDSIMSFQTSQLMSNTEQIDLGREELELAE